MINKKQLGIWMDHAVAHLIEFNTNDNETKTIESDIIEGANDNGMSKGEKTMHNKEQNNQSDHYKKIAEVIKSYDEVILFGPTDAKSELLNILKLDHHFDKIKIETKQVDKMSENQEHAFVKEYFSKN